MTSIPRLASEISKHSVRPLGKEQKKCSAPQHEQEQALADLAVIWREHGVRDEKLVRELAGLSQEMCFSPEALEVHMMKWLRSLCGAPFICQDDDNSPIAEPEMTRFVLGHLSLTGKEYRNILHSLPTDPKVSKILRNLFPLSIPVERQLAMPVQEFGKAKRK